MGEELEGLVEALQMRISALEEKTQYLNQLIEFWNGPVPQKYKKFNPNPGEYPFFRHKVKEPLEVSELPFGKDPEWKEAKIPSDPEERKKAWERMKAYALEPQKIPCQYFELWENGSLIGEKLSEADAEEWVRQGKVRYYFYEKDTDVCISTCSEALAKEWDRSEEGRFSCAFNERHYKSKWKRVFPKQESSEASSTSSTRQGSPLENIGP